MSPRASAGLRHRTPTEGRRHAGAERDVPGPLHPPGAGGEPRGLPGAGERLRRDRPGARRALLPRARPRRPGDGLTPEPGIALTAAVVEFRDRAHRDEVMAAVLADPRVEGIAPEPVAD